jgi:hypothetical protein
MGVVIPLTPKAVPDALICGIVTLSVPTFVKLIVCDFTFPTTTSPKLMFVERAKVSACLEYALDGDEFTLE